jgi:phosphate transport system permease protein
MTATETLAPPSDPAQWFGQHSMSRSRRVRNGIASAWMIGAVALALVPVALIVSYVAVKGAKVMSWGFLSKNLPFASEVAGGGIWPAIGGTVILTATAAAMAVPLGVLAAVYLNEYGAKRPLARTIRFMSDVMTGVPSVVMGLFVYLSWSMSCGYSAFGGALALACLMLPVVIGSTEQMLRLVPQQLREAAYALGATKSRTIVTVVVPAALPGIISGSLLAVARAAGETAPLLFTIGVVRETNTSLFKGQNTALSVQIFTNATSPFSVQQDRAWGAALTLIVIVFIFTILARLVTAFFSRRQAA